MSFKFKFQIFLVFLSFIFLIFISSFTYSAPCDFNNGGDITGMDRNLGNLDNYDLGFLTNKSTRILIKNDGKVGIGTTSPDSKLEVFGSGEDGGVRADHFDVKTVDAPTGVTATTVSGTALEVGNYTYFIAYKTYAGETEGFRVDVTTTSGNQAVELSGLATTDARVTQIKIYRNRVNENAYFSTVAGTTTPSSNTYTDTTPDASLTNADEGSVIYNPDTSSNILTVNNTPIMLATEVTRFGYEAGVNGPTAGNPVSIGYQAGKGAYYNGGYGAVAIGGEAGKNAYMFFNVAIGKSALENNDDIRCTAVGHSAGSNNDEDELTAVGFYAGRDNSGRDNTFIGARAGNENDGQYNVGLGYATLKNNSSKNSVAIGYEAGMDNTDNGQFIVKHSMANSTPLIQGNFYSGNVGIGTTDPDTKIHNTGAYTQEPLSSDPSDPSSGNSVQWVSDGTGSGDAGDVMMKINVGGTVKTITLVDFSDPSSGSGGSSGSGDLPTPDVNLDITGDCFLELNDCTNRSFLSDRNGMFCDYNLLLPPGASAAHIDIYQGTDGFGNRSQSFFYDQNNLTYTIWVDQLRTPTTLVCSSVSSTYFVQDVIDTLVIAPDPSHSLFTSHMSFMTKDTDNSLIIKFLGIVLVIIAIIGLLNLSVNYFSKNKSK